MNLHDRVVALEGAVTALAAMEFGDSPGHEFHGNQWSSSPVDHVVSAIESLKAQNLRQVIIPVQMEGKSLAHVTLTNPRPSSLADTTDAEMLKRFATARDQKGDTASIGHIIRNGILVDATIRASHAPPAPQPHHGADVHWDYLRQPGVVRSTDPASLARYPKNPKTWVDDYNVTTIELGDSPGHDFHGNQYSGNPTDIKGDRDLKANQAARQHHTNEIAKIAEKTRKVMNPGPATRSLWDRQMKEHQGAIKELEKAYYASPIAKWIAGFEGRPDPTVTPPPRGFTYE